MACTIDASPSGVASNSYATIAQADVYFETRLHADAWGVAIDEEKCAALQTATRLLDSWVVWDGTAAIYTQRLAWPRSGLLTIAGGSLDHASIPDAVVAATCELALLLLAQDVTARPEQAAQGLSSLSVGSVSLSFSQSAQLADAERILPPNVWGLIRPWAFSRRGASNSVRLSRV